MKRVYGLLLAAAVALCLGGVLGCSLAGADSRPASTLSQSQLTGALSSTDDAYSIRIPENWRELDNLSPDAILSCGDPNREQYLMVIPDSRSATGMNFQEYTTVVLHQVGTGLEDAVIGQSTDFMFRDQAGSKTSVSGTADGVKVRYWVYTVECPDDYLQIVAWTLEDKAAETQGLFDQIARTLGSSSVQSG